MASVEVLVLGTGPTGGTVAKKCAAAGKKVAIAESREFGGTCALRGCNPKKVLVRAAEVTELCQRSRGTLLSEESQATIDWPKLIAFKREFTDSVPESSRSSLNEEGILTLEGPTRFVSPTTVRCGDTDVEADHICIATGSRPASLDIPGEDLAITSDEFMTLAELPRDILFIGAGYIAFEFAHVAARANARVTVVGRGDQALSEFDVDLVDTLVQYSKSNGIDVRTGTEVRGIKRKGGGYRVTVGCGDDEEKIETELVVHAAGRVPNLDGLDLERGEVSFGENGIEVDPHLRSTSNPRVHAGGDCAAHSASNLTPVANEDARTIVQALTEGITQEPSYGVVPAAVFSVPSIARIGMSEEDARKHAKDLRVSQGDWSKWGSLKKLNAPCGEFKILIDSESDQILGAHLLGPSASETINLFAVAMRAGMSAKELKSTLLVFPTFGADVRAML